MPTLTVNLQTVHPSEPWWPDEDQLGDKLSRLVKHNLETGAPTTAVVVHRDRVVLVPLRPFVEAKVNLPMLLAGLARWDEGDGLPEAIGLVGRVQLRRGKDAGWVPLATVFLEWPDGRWWHWQTLLDADGAMLEDTESTERATDGLPRPNGLGGWWRLARLRKPNLNLRRHTPALGSELVQ